MIPRQPNVLTPKLTLTFLAVLSGCTTLTEVADACGIPRSSAYRRLQHLRKRGLIGWDRKRAGTIHALYAPRP